MGNYKVCVYAICKNEEPFVDRWMDSMSEADRVLVLDTGSEDRTVERLEQLMACINLTNSKTSREGKTITELLAHRDCLKSRIQVMRNFLDNASNKVGRMTHSEIRIKSTVPVSEIQKRVDLLSKELRQCDELIQELNWTTELQGL